VANVWNFYDQYDGKVTRDIYFVNHSQFLQQKIMAVVIDTENKHYSNAIVELFK
jgi:hypothetical protein